MQKDFAVCNIIIKLYFCILFFLVTECKTIRNREKRQLNPCTQFSNYASQYPDITFSMYPSLNRNPCFHLNVNTQPFEEYYPQQMPGNIIDFASIWPNWPLLFPQASSFQQQHQFFWPYNYQQSISSLPPPQPTNNEPKTTLQYHVTSESKNNIGDSRPGPVPAITNPEISSYSPQFDHVQNDPIQYNHQVLRTSSSVTKPKTLNIIRSFTDSEQAPEVSIQEENLSQTPIEGENTNRPENPVDSTPKEENKEDDEDGGMSQEENQESQQNNQRQPNVADNKNEIRKNGKGRRRQNQPSDEENEDEYYYEYLH